MNQRRMGLALLLLGSGLALEGAWIPAKARLAQHLLARAWAESHATGRQVPPWPWADTHPVARLAVPRLGIDQVVLAGVSGRTLAFGPGHWEGGAPPGSRGHVVLAGHRDTHFSFLRDLQPGDELRLAGPGGEARRYRVAWARVAHESEGALIAEEDGPALTLVTCFPFDAAVPGGPLRWVVRAELAGR